MSPAVRRLLAEHRVRPDDLTGSGAGGRITADDVLAHVAARTARRHPVPAQPPPCSRQVSRARPGSGASRTRRSVAGSPSTW